MSRAIEFTPPIEGGVVVGFDGSGPGLHALRWAWSEALTRGAPLHVVRAWTIATAAGLVDVPPGVVPGIGECEQALATETAQSIDRLRVGATPELHVHVVHGHAGEVLVAAGAEADLLVVGHRGHSLVTLVLGSVAAHVLEHARCPVVVLPGHCVIDRPDRPGA